MQIHHQFDHFFSEKPLALSLGMFDGVHRGHQSILSALQKTAAEKNLETAVLTFWPHPRLVFNPGDKLQLLNTINEKTDILQSIGIKHLIIKDFDDDFRNMDAEAFVKEILVKKLNIRHLIIGHDHEFGKNRRGNFQLLEKLAPDLGFRVQQMEAVNMHNQHISSTKIRNVLLAGNISAANEMLGYHFPLTGTVIHGKKIGRTIGYPTANLEVNPIKLLPKKGAYIVQVQIKGENCKGMLSIGTNPTVGGENLTVEVYILNFDREIYGETVSIKFRDFLHDEIKFESVEKLVERLDHDKELTERFIF